MSDIKPTLHQHRIRSKSQSHSAYWWSEWRDGSPNLMPESEKLFDVEERDLFADADVMLLVSEETKKARTSALEEAAKVAEAFKRRRLGRDLSKAYFDPCGRWEGGEIYEQGKEKDLIALRIRALGHEPLSEPELVDALSALQSEER